MEQDRWEARGFRRSISDLIFLRYLTCPKLKLVNPSQYRFEHLVTQMKWRLQEGRGEAVYQIGVEDNGLLVGLAEEEMRASLKTLHRMAEKYASHSPSVLLTRLWRRPVNTQLSWARGAKEGLSLCCLLLTKG